MLHSFLVTSNQDYENNSKAKLVMGISRPYWKGEHYLLTRNRWLFLHFVCFRVFILALDIGKQYPPKVKRAVIHVNDGDREAGQGHEWLWVHRADLWLCILGEVTTPCYQSSHVLLPLYLLTACTGAYAHRNRCCSSQSLPDAAC